MPARDTGTLNDHVVEVAPGEARVALAVLWPVWKAPVAWLYQGPVAPSLCTCAVTAATPSGAEAVPVTVMLPSGLLRSAPADG